MEHLNPVIYVVDDDASVLRAVSRLLRSSGYRVVEFNSAEELLEEYDPRAHGCVVLDIAMPGISGLELQQQLVAQGALLPVIFLTGRGDIPMTVSAMRLGAWDFLTKPVQREKLESAVEAAIKRDRAAQRERAAQEQIRECLAQLTPREHEVLLHVVSGKLNKQTAAELGTVEKTVKVHRARIMRKMKVVSLAELVQLTQRAGIRASGSSGAESLLDQRPISIAAVRS